MQSYMIMSIDFLQKHAKNIHVIVSIETRVHHQQTTLLIDMCTIKTTQTYTNVISQNKM